LRPQKLLDVRQKIREENVSPEEAGLPAVEKEAVGQIVKEQLDLGFKAVTDGEYTRTRFWGLFWDELEGTTRLQDAEASMFRLYHPDVVSLIEKDRKVMPGDSVIAGGKIKHVGTKSDLHELQLVQQFVPKSDWGAIKMTMITPAVSLTFIHLFQALHYPFILHFDTRVPLSKRSNEVNSNFRIKYPHVLASDLRISQNNEYFDTKRQKLKPHPLLRLPWKVDLDSEFGERTLSFFFIRKVYFNCDGGFEPDTTPAAPTLVLPLCGLIGILHGIYY
jgi:hypothetical protein